MNEITDFLEMVRSPEFARQLESLRNVTMIVGAGATEEHELVWARDVLNLLLALKRLDKRLQ